MKISRKVLCIPPYLSISWDQIAYMQAFFPQDSDQGEMHITCKDAKTIVIPLLSPKEIHTIFACHARFLEEPYLSTPSISFDMISSPLHLCEHDPAQQNAPDLPGELLQQFSRLSTVLDASILSVIPKPEPHCNCPCCQISRVIHAPTSSHYAPQATWNIYPIDQNSYKVSHTEQQDISFLVSLSPNVHCSCGSHTCEHIRMVLRS